MENIPKSNLKILSTYVVCRDTDDKMFTPKGGWTENVGKAWHTDTIVVAEKLISEIYVRTDRDSDGEKAYNCYYKPIINEKFNEYTDTRPKSRKTSGRDKKGTEKDGVRFGVQLGFDF